MGSVGLGGTVRPKFPSPALLARVPGVSDCHLAIHLLGQGEASTAAGAAAEVGSGSGGSGASAMPAAAEMSTAVASHSPKTAAAAPTRRKYHVVISVSDSKYVRWQVRINYYWYKKVKAAYPDSDMGVYTRLLHAFKVWCGPARGPGGR